MKKTVLLLSALFVAGAAFAQKDVTPPGYDFSKYEDGALFKVSPSNVSSWSMPANYYIENNGAENMAKDGHVTVLLQRGAVAEANNAESVANLNDHLFISDRGPGKGKCLVFTTQYSPLVRPEGNAAGHGFTASPQLNFLIDPTRFDDFAEGTTRYMRVKFVFNVLQRGCHFQNTNPGNVKVDDKWVVQAYATHARNWVIPSDDHVLPGNSLWGIDFARWVDETVNVNDIPETPEVKFVTGLTPDDDPFDSSHDASSANHDKELYIMNPDRFVVYEYDIPVAYEPNGGAHSVTFNVNHNGSSANYPSVVFHEIKFTDLGTNEADATLLGKRSIKYIYLAEGAVNDYENEPSQPEQPSQPELPELKGAGTQADPYLIGTAADLCAAHLYIDQETAGDRVYFKQTADIDMAGIKDYEALNGWYGSYNGTFCYDGDYHVIRNFEPEDKVASRIDDDADHNGGYYDCSLFGVIKGEIKNLGVINAKVNDVNNFDRAGILGCYAGHGGVDAIVTNVFVTGESASVKGAGGMFGTMGANVVLSDAYADVKVTGNNGCVAGGIIGNSANKLTIDGGYVHAVVEGTDGKTALIAAAAGTVDIVNDFILIGKGDAVASGVTLNKASGKYYAEYEEVTSEAIEDIQAMDLFNAGKLLNDMPTFNWMTGEDVVAPLLGSGTEADPYLIGTAADLCQAWTKRVVGGTVYYKQTADIDMAGVTDYHAIQGFDGNYNSSMVYDGDYHVIRNFAPECHSNAVQEEGWYYPSVFGMIDGTVKNLGVINANVIQTNGTAATTGILAGVAGHSSGVVGSATIENCFVDGKVESLGDGTGGLVGRTYGEKVTITGCYANVDVKTKTEGAGIVGSLNGSKVILTDVYAAGTVALGEGATGSAADLALVVAVRMGKTGTVEFDEVVAMNSGAESATNAPATGTCQVLDKDAAIAAIQAWPEFNEEKMLNGVPTLNWMTDDQISSVDNVVADEVDANAPVEYFNLQGVRVENPTTGLYIKRQGNVVSKVVIR